MTSTASIHWSDAWQKILGLPAELPPWVIAVSALVCIYTLVIVPSSAVMTFLERKIGADLQARVGPNRSGPAGIFQPLVDLLKLLQKEANEKTSWEERLWLSVHTMALYSTVAVLPLGSMILLVDTEMSAFLPFWAALVLALGTMLLGLDQGSVPGWFGGVRVASQALAGAFPALVCILCAGIRAGGFSWSLLAGTQGASPLAWGSFSSPFEFVAFGVFMISGLVLMGVPPLDGGLSVQDIHGGVASHLHGTKLSLFRMGRFYGFFLWSVIAVVLFLGAWSLPVDFVTAMKESEAWRWLELGEAGVLLFKTFSLMLLVGVIARVTPRMRADQITDLAWKVLSPLALFALAGSAIWSGWAAIR